MPRMKRLWSTLFFAALLLFLVGGAVMFYEGFGHIDADLDGAMSKHRTLDAFLLAFAAHAIGLLGMALAAWRWACARRRAGA